MTEWIAAWPDWGKFLFVITLMLIGCGAVVWHLFSSINQHDRCGPYY